MRRTPPPPPSVSLRLAFCALLLAACDAPPAEAPEGRAAESALGALVADARLPTLEGETFACVGEVLERGVVISRLSSEQNPLTICARPGANPEALRGVCKRVCAETHRGGLALARLAGPAGFEAPTCQIVDAAPTGLPCAPPKRGVGRFLNGGPEQVLQRLSSSSISFVGDDGPATISGSGPLEVDSGGCAPGEDGAVSCRMALVSVRLSFSPFSLAGRSITDIQLRNDGIVYGQTSSTGDAIVAPGAFRGTLSARVDGVPTSVLVQNVTPLTGPWSETVTNLSGRLEGGGVGLDVQIGGFRDGAPPVVVEIAPLAEPVVCGAPATFEARVQDRNGDLAGIFWNVDGVRRPGAGPQRLTVTFASGGTHRIALAAFDGRVGLGVRERDVEVSCPAP